MTSRESRRAQINDILQHFDDDITRLTRLNVRIYKNDFLTTITILKIIFDLTFMITSRIKLLCSFKFITFSITMNF